MLLRFTLSNFASVRDMQELSTIAQDEHDDLAIRRVPRTDLHSLPVVGLFGPNASGKSNIVQALDFVSAAVAFSHQRWLPESGIPRRPFLLAADPEASPSHFNIEFVADDGVRYEYGFECDSRRFLKEWLFSYPEGRSRRIFERELDQPILFGPTLRGPKTQVERVVRPNSLFLSAAAANNYGALEPVSKWFRTGIRIALDENFDARLLETRHRFERPNSKAILNLLRYADLGVTGVKFSEVKLSPEHAAKIAEMLRLIDEEAHDVNPSQISGGLEVELAHKVGDREFNLPLEYESNGTKTWLAIVGPIVTTLQNGSTLVIDELDARLHPHVAAQFVRLFQDPRTNPKGAQLIFNTHDAGLIGPELPFRLRRDQIWITEKLDGATRIFPLSDYKVRSVENIEKRYLGGRYGGLPFFDEELLSAVIQEVSS